MAAEGKTNETIAMELSSSKPTVGRWRSRFAVLRLAGIEKDAPHPGRTPAVSAEIVELIVRKTTQEKPEAATHWSTRTMAKAVGVGKDTVQRVWAAHGLKPHLVKTFKVSNDPQFTEKLEDAVGALGGKPPRGHPVRIITLCPRIITQSSPLSWWASRRSVFFLLRFSTWINTMSRQPYSLSSFNSQSLNPHTSTIATNPASASAHCRSSSKNARTRSQAVLTWRRDTTSPASSRRLTAPACRRGSGGV